MKTYKGKTLKIRAAKILEIKDARNDQTVIYKNIDAIRYLNDKWSIYVTNLDSGSASKQKCTECTFISLC